ncbi:hypothetical protein SAY87_026366 [Trapa incisa]|uniref:Bifunctional inhibitor/plant lipid transfer protein/seed storage helical domain-containing protein n=1 Tax=Trapa incisa TaxID=236973 RepID=A0AAN7GZE1_9MYRT|nr:hypothetical protein SAY87_026366 [Trapa incisa]
MRHMALSNIFSLALLALYVAALAVADHEGEAAEPFFCSNIIYNMMDCIPYLSNGSPSTDPDPTCCSGANTVLDFNGECVCVAIQKSSILGIQLNITRVWSLPSICGMKDYSLKNCDFWDLYGSSSSSLPAPDLHGPASSPSPASDLHGSSPSPSPGNAASDPHGSSPGNAASYLHGSSPSPSPGNSASDLHGSSPSPSPVPYLHGSSASPSPDNSLSFSPSYGSFWLMNSNAFESPQPSEEPPSASAREAPGPAPMMDPPYNKVATCDDVNYNMWECVPYLNNHSQSIEPNRDCCLAYITVVDFDPKCICTFTESSKRLGVGFNMSKLEQLPSYCGFHAYPLEKCNSKYDHSHTKNYDHSHVKKPDSTSHSGCRSLASSSFAAAVVARSIAFVSVLFMSSH